MDDHLKRECPNRNFACKYCGKEDTYMNIIEFHDKLCLKKVVPCPNMECQCVMQRQEIECHISSDCKYAVIPCKYSSLGCGAKKTRAEMSSHEQKEKQLHLDMAMDATLKLKKDLESVEDTTL